MTIFISYSHKDGEWVHNYLLPVLRAATADVLIDIERFTAGKAVRGQLDDAQDRAKFQILVVTKSYLESDYCRHEMNRAIAGDPGFSKGKVLPIRRDSVDLPDCLVPNSKLGSEPIYVDLRSHKDIAPWKLLLGSCGLALPGTDAPSWFRTLDQTKKHLERGESVNLVVRNPEVDWRHWLVELTDTRFDELASVDLDHPRAVPRNGLISEILKATGRSHADVPSPPDDLPLLADAFENGERSFLALRHFDSVKHRDHYGPDFFSSLRWAVMDVRQLVLLAHTDVPVADLLPPRHQLSAIDFKTVELG